MPVYPGAPVYSVLQVCAVAARAQLLTRAGLFEMAREGDVRVDWAPVAYGDASTLFGSHGQPAIRDYQSECMKSERERVVLPSRGPLKKKLE